MVAKCPGLSNRAYTYEKYANRFFSNSESRQWEREISCACVAIGKPDFDASPLELIMAALRGLNWPLRVAGKVFGSALADMAIFS